MGFRRKKEEAIIGHKWKQFVSDQTILLQEIGLPAWISDEHEYWRDVICYGYPEQYQGIGPASVPDFDLSGARTSELTLFVELLERYFQAGFPWLNPEFLKWRDRISYDRIVAQFAR